MESDERAYSNWAQAERDEKNMTMSSLRMEFEDLESKHKRLSKKCKHRGKLHGYKKHSWDQCAHDSMDYGGMTRNTDCELINCPLMIEKE